MIWATYLSSFMAMSKGSVSPSSSTITGAHILWVQGQVLGRLQTQGEGSSRKSGSSRHKQDWMGTLVLTFEADRRWFRGTDREGTRVGARRPDFSFASKALNFSPTLSMI